MRGRPKALLPIEVSILDATQTLAQRGQEKVHGFQLSKEIADRDGARFLTGYGTLYRALDRLQKAGLLASEWEDPLIAAEERRPRRRFYWITATGMKALAEAPSTSALRLAPGGSPA